MGRGDGRPTALIAERLPKGSVLGVDRSASMFTLAREQLPVGVAAARSSDSRLGFLQMDATRLELPRAGFRVARADQILTDMRHPGRETFLGWLRTTWFPYTDRVPAESRDDFLEEVAAACVEMHPPDEAGVFHVRVLRLEMEATVA